MSTPYFCHHSEWCQDVSHHRSQKMFWVPKHARLRGVLRPLWSCMVNNLKLGPGRTCAPCERWLHCVTVNNFWFWCSDFCCSEHLSLSLTRHQCTPLRAAKVTKICVSLQLQLPFAIIQVGQNNCTQTLQHQDMNYIHILMYRRRAIVSMANIACRLSF